MEELNQTIVKNAYPNAEEYLWPYDKQFYILIKHREYTGYRIDIIAKDPIKAAAWQKASECVQQIVMNAVAQ